MKINELYVMRTIGANTMLINKKDPQKMAKLNETAAFILSKVSEGCTVEDIAASLSQEYDVPSDKALSDTKKALDNLIQIGIVEA